MSATPASRGLLLPRLAAALGAWLMLGAAEFAPAAALPSVPSSTFYYRTRDLDVQPGIMTRVEPTYPDTALARNLSGKVVIRLYINEKGTVDRVETLSAKPAGYFEASAERDFERREDGSARVRVRAPEGRPPGVDIRSGGVGRDTIEAEDHDCRELPDLHFRR